MIIIKIGEPPLIRGYMQCIILQCSVILGIVLLSGADLCSFKSLKYNGGLMLVEETTVLSIYR